MFYSRIRQRESGILIYGICPPKVHTPLDKVVSSAEKLGQNLSMLDIDALVVYDVQDESARTSEERPFPFINSLDPLEYATQYLKHIPVPKIIYRPAGMFGLDELSAWLEEVSRNKFYPVFVGVPSPDYIPKTSLADAYEVWRKHYSATSVIGAVTIPERHAELKDEQHRILDKVAGGVSFFISQCVFHVEYAKRIVDDLATICKERGVEIPTIIFTLTICGSPKTLQFMEWLGIYVPAEIRDELSASDDQVACSLRIASSIANELIGHCTSRAVPFGFNIESVAIKRDEIEASLRLVGIVNTQLQAKGLRKEASVLTAKTAS